MYTVVLSRLCAAIETETLAQPDLDNVYLPVPDKLWQWRSQEFATGGV